MQADRDTNRQVWYTENGNRYCESREEGWLRARDAAVSVAEAFMDADYHKQNPNRLLEPFSWIDTLITSTDWDNFLWLREHGAAEPHLQDLAALVHAALTNAEVQHIDYDEWHMPYITDEDCYDIEQMFGISEEFQQALLKLSAARSARISYKPFDGDSSYEREFERYNMLVTSDRVHASPTEHQAKPDHVKTFGGSVFFESPHLHGNLDGYIQYRKIIPNECYTGRII